MISARQCRLPTLIPVPCLWLECGFSVTNFFSISNRFLLNRRLKIEKCCTNEREEQSALGKSGLAEWEKLEKQVRLLPNSCVHVSDTRGWEQQCLPSCARENKKREK
jgi:hypothetical protein